MSTHRTLLITGAAGALGRATVATLAARGDHLLLLDREAELLHAAFPAYADSSPHTLLVADVTDAQAVGQAVQEATKSSGRLDGLIHIAGGFTMGDGVHELSRDTWQQMMDLNAWSFAACARAVVPQLQAAGGGQIVAVSARSASQGLAGMSAYIASKSALQRLVESLSAELREQGIAVNSVAPSIIDTPANRQAMPDADPSRWVAPQRLAEIIAFLASDAAEVIHGQHLVVSGLS